MNKDRAIFIVRTSSEGGKKQSLDLTGRVESFEYLDHTAKADKLELTLDNRDLKNFDDPVWHKGAVLEVSWGYPGNMSETRRCVVKSVKGGLSLKIIAYEETFLMHQVQKCRDWRGMSLQQIADAIQQEYKYIFQWEKKVSKDPQVGSVADNIQIVHALQAAETDAQFLARMARKYGMTFSTSARGRIQFHEIDLTKPPIKTITWRGGNGDWQDFQIENDITGLVGGVTMKGIDTASKKEIAHTSNNDNTQRAGLMPSIELQFDAKTGEGTFVPGQTDPDNTPSTVADIVPVGAGSATIIGRTLGYVAKVAHVANVFMNNGLNVATSIENTQTNESGSDQVQAKAEGKFKASQRSQIKLEGTIIGDPKVRAKQILDVRGLGKRVSGKYHIVQARHHIDSKGKYKVDFVANSDGHGGYAGAVNTPNKADINKKAPVDQGSNVEMSLVHDAKTGQSHFEFTRKDADK